MDAVLLLRAAGALATVLGLLVGGLWLYRRYGDRIGMPTPRLRPQARLAVVERLMLEPRRSLVLVRRDSREYLLLLGPDSAQIVGSETLTEVSE
jgi:flagellar protein FliO/FliZ